jgi:hypothetical protein
MNTSFGVTIDARVTAYDQEWLVRCTVSNKAMTDEPVLMWCDCLDPDRAFVPALVWDAVEMELTTGGPARDAYLAAMAKADIPFMAERAA